MFEILNKGNNLLNYLIIAGLSKLNSHTFRFLLVIRLLLTQLHGYGASELRKVKICSCKGAIIHREQAPYANCALRGVSASLRSVLNACHWHAAPCGGQMTFGHRQGRCPSPGRHPTSKMWDKPCAASRLPRFSIRKTEYDNHRF